MNLFSQLSDAVMLGLIATIQAVVAGILAVIMKIMDNNAKLRDLRTSAKVDETTAKVEEVRKTTDGIIPKLVAAGKIEAKYEERDRAATVAETDRAREVEIIRRIQETKSSELNVPQNVAVNVEVIKEDVKDVKEDVRDVKAEVLKVEESKQ